MLMDGGLIFMNDTLLKGYSGFKLSVNRDGDGYSFVKSASSNSERLMMQCEKQIRYQKLLENSSLGLVFDVPNVLKKDAHSITMQYCFGKSIIDFIQTEDCTSIDWIVDNLSSLIDWEINQCNLYPLVSGPFKDKLKGIPNPDNIHNDVLCRIKDIEIPMGFCHGDLTLSNMIFARKIILVDFHDPFIETPIQDIVKLLQEVDLRWSLLMYNRDVDRSKVSIAYEYLKRRIYELTESISVKYDIPRDVIFVFHLMVLVRLLAYAQNEQMYNLILKKCKELLKNEKKLNTSYCW